MKIRVVTTGKRLARDIAAALSAVEAAERRPTDEELESVHAQLDFLTRRYVLDEPRVLH